MGIPCHPGNPAAREPEDVTLDELLDAASDEPATLADGHRRSGTSSPPYRPIPRTWVCLAEWVLGGWSATLRAASLISAILVVVGAITATLIGVYGATAVVAGFIALMRVLPHPATRTVPR